MKTKRKPIFVFTMILFCLVMVCSMPAIAADNIVDVVSTVAGDGVSGYSGDGGPAASARISSVYGLAVDGAGNVFIPDYGNNRIRKVDTDGNISTVAGIGSMGYSGDGGPALSAKLKFPAAVAVDSTGNLYIADRNNYRIRKVDTSGNISTIVGTGSSGYTGDNGPAIDAQIRAVQGLAVDGTGNLYIADTGNYRIRKVDTNGYISTVVGNGSNGYSGDDGPAVDAQISQVYQLAIDSEGNLYFADSNNNRIRKVNTGGVVTTVAGNGTGGFSGDGGPATAAQLDFPHGVIVDSAGSMYIADSNNQRIRKVDASGNISTLAGNGTYGFYDGMATAAKLYSPYAVAIDATGKLYIADTSNYRIRVVKSVELDPTVPSWPDMTFTVSDLTSASLTLNWNPAADDVAVVGYKVYQATSLLTPDLVSTTTYTVNGLTQNTTYTFTVQAVDGDGKESLFGPMVSATTLDDTPPTWTNGTLTQSRLVADSITLNWSVATDNQNKLLGYKIYQGTTLLTTDPVTANTYTVNGLNAGAPYTFTVQAIDTSGNESSDGPSLSVTTNPYDVAPPAWTNGSLTTSDLTSQTVTLNWSGDSDNIGVTGYKVKIYKGADTSALADQIIVTGTSCTLPLFTGMDNTIKVEAFDANENESTDGPQVTVTTGKLSTGVSYPLYTNRPMSYEDGVIIDLLSCQVPADSTLTRLDYTPDVPGLKVGGKFIKIQATGIGNVEAKVTLPLVEGVDSSKCTIYYWNGFYETGRVTEKVGNSLEATVSVNNMINSVGIFEDTEAPVGYYIHYQDFKITSNNVSIMIKEPKTGTIAYPDPSGIIGYNIYRDDILLGNYPMAKDQLGNHWQYFDTVTYPGFNDNTVQPGQTYRYSAEVIDWFGNVSARLPEVTAYIPLDDADVVAKIKAMELITFADGDSADSVTQKLTREPQPYSNATVTFTSSDSTILNTGTWKVIKPADADSAQVTLTETITCGSVTETKVYNLTVQWTETAPVSTVEEFTTALNKSLVKNIVLTSNLSLENTYNCLGKSITANFSGDYIFWASWQYGLNLGNFTFNGNGVSTISKFADLPDYLAINLDSINFLGMDNYDYIINASENNIEQTYEVILNYCQVPKVKNYAVYATSSTLGSVGKGKKITLTNNTFAHGADIRIEAGVATIMNNTINSKFIAYKGATLNGIAITDAATAETAVNALLASEAGNQFNAPTDGSYGITIYDTDGTTVLYQTSQTTAPVQAPNLTADTINNSVNQSIDITFTDDAAWRAVISDVTVNGTSVSGKYQVGEGKITINGEVFAIAQDYTIIVKATGYPDATVAQPITLTSVTRVAQPALITVSPGNNAGSLLPTTVTVEFSDGTSSNCSVIWDNANTAYDSQTPGTYIFHGNITLPEGVINPSNLSATATIVIQANTSDDKASLCLNAINTRLGEFVSASLNGNTINAVIKEEKEELSLQDSFDIANSVLILTDINNSCTVDSITIGTATFTHQDIFEQGLNKIPEIQAAVVALAGKPTGTSYNDLKLKDLAGTQLVINLGGTEVTVALSSSSIDECFIATAAFGSKFEPSVAMLRSFRDKFLLTNTLGQAFVKFYYHNSPPIANYIAHNDFLKAGVRGMLTPVVGVVYLMFHPVLMYSVVIGFILLIAAMCFLKRRSVTGRL